MRRQLSACSIGENKPDTKGGLTCDCRFSTFLLALIAGWPARSAPLELDGYGGAGLLGMTERAKAHGGR